jgi:glycosyltransferase involved in cell wall biosynthesis
VIIAVRKSKTPIFALAHAILRRVLPAPVKRALVRYVSTVEAAVSRFDPAAHPSPGSLTRCAPLLKRSAFADGPIVLVNNALAWGGAERQLVNTIRGLKARSSHEIMLLCQKLGKSADYDFYRPALTEFGENVRNMTALPVARKHLAKEVADGDLQRLARTFAWMPDDVQERVWQLMSDFIKLKPSVVHAWQDALGIEGGYAAHLAGVPRVIVSTRNLPPTNFAYYRPYMDAAFAELARCPEVVLLNNSEAGARAYANWLHLEPARVKVLRNGFDPGKGRSLDRSAARAELGVPDDTHVVGSIFRFYEEKRPMLWLETAARIAARTDAHFVIFGTGPLLEDVRAGAARAGIADRLHLPGADRDAARKLAAFDAFLLTSAHEGTPNVALEASAAGVPVVTTAAGGAPETVLEGVTGFVVTSSEPDDLADTVLRVLEDEAFRTACAVEGPRFIAERFSVSHMLDETITLYALQDSVS